MTARPPERLAGEAVVLERVGPRRRDSMHAAIVASHHELHRWMDWAGAEPQTEAQTDEFIATAGREWEDGTAFNYAMTDPGTGEVIGVCGLMTRQGPDRLEIGFWVRTDRAGAGIATAAAGLLTDAAWSVDGIDLVEIHHDEANGASGRVAEKLGYRERERFDTTVDNPGERGVQVVWELSRPARP